MGAPTTAADPTERKRLHITPFNPTLLDRFIPPSLKPSATGISFHAVETFPERGFGYVELPAMEAEKLKKKLNGMTLKGTKVRIEDAKPEKKKRKAQVEDEDGEKKVKKVKKEKRKREDGVLPGHELEEGRHVKRGWAEDDKKKAKKPKTKGDVDVKDRNLQFKTSVPPNAEPVKTKAKTKTKEKKEAKEVKDPKVKRKTVVQEFAKSQKPIASTTKTNSSKRATEFEEGKGWVNEDGEVVEPAPVSTRPRQTPRDWPPPRRAKSKKAEPKELSAEGEESSEATSDDEESSVVSDDSSEAVSSDDSEALEATPQTVEPLPTTDQAETATPSAAKEVHPLEALFKRPAPKPESATKPKPSPIDTSFSFFNSGAADEDGDTLPGAEAGAYPPQTPHTKQDLEWRSIRSAAPTPDTAAIGRKFSFPFAQGGEDDEDEDEDEDEVMEDIAEATEPADGDAKVDTPTGAREESEFRKWFYEKRGEHNRGWKKARREGKKAARQRENRRLSRRVV